MYVCAVCKKDASAICSKCQKVAYCGVTCQTEDWKMHKKQCGKPLPSAPRIHPIPDPRTFSPFGQTFNVYTGKSTPLSHNSIFFGEMFGYNVNNPEKVYAELVDTFRLRRLNDAVAGKPTGPASAAFMDFLEKAKKTKILPGWWNEGVHEPGLIKYVEGDNYGRLDRVVDEQEVFARHSNNGKLSVEMRLQMMAERIWGSTSQLSC